MAILPARIEARFFGELFPEFAFGVADLGWGLNYGLDDEISGIAFATRQATASDTEFLSILRAGRNADVDTAIEGGDCDACAEDGFPGREWRFVDEVVILDLEVGMFREVNTQIKIASSTTAGTKFAATGHAQPLSFSD